MPFSGPLVRPLLYRARIRPRPDGRFDLARDGAEAFLVNVPDDLGYLGDCVGWLRGDPGEWWALERRIAILGLPELTFASDFGCDLFLVESPATYVELAVAGPWPGPAATIIDWNARHSLGLWLSLVRGVQCETPALARAVRGALDAEPARERLRIRIAEPAAPVQPAAPEFVEADDATVLEPFPLRELGDVHTAEDREELVD